MDKYALMRIDSLAEKGFEQTVFSRKFLVAVIKSARKFAQLKQLNLNGAGL